MTQTEAPTTHKLSPMVEDAERFIVTCSCGFVASHVGPVPCRSLAAAHIDAAELMIPGREW